MLRPEGVTGTGEGEDMLFHSDINSPDGATFTLFVEKHHTKEDVERAKRWLKKNRDVVRIILWKLETTVNQ